VLQSALALKNLARLRGYEPQPVTIKRLWIWLRQFPTRERLALLRLLTHVRFVSKSEAIRALLTQNDAILERLREDGVGIENVIYVSLDSAGSSSGVMLNLLRDRANLERRGARFAHSGEVDLLRRLTTELKRGAVIYVDDFAGSGKQFIRNRRHAFSFVTGSFSEFFLTVCACEEAQIAAENDGVESVTSIVHRTTDRPLHPNGALVSDGDKRVLVDICKRMNRRSGLGFEQLATSIVLYRNAPNSTPLVLRGNLEQAPLRGVLPRYDDLAISAENASL
jgi:hypothetical protein